MTAKCASPMSPPPRPCCRPESGHPRKLTTPVRPRQKDHMNQAETRAEHIDPALKAAGWGVVEGSKVLREHPITLGRLEGIGGKRGKSLKADYMLVYQNHKLAIIEAKAWDEPLTAGVGQAKDYAGKMAIRFVYAS